LVSQPFRSLCRDTSACWLAPPFREGTGREESSRRVPTMPRAFFFWAASNKPGPIRTLAGPCGRTAHRADHFRRHRATERPMALPLTEWEPTVGPQLSLSSTADIPIYGRPCRLPAVAPGAPGSGGALFRRDRGGEGGQRQVRLRLIHVHEQRSRGSNASTGGQLPTARTSSEDGGGLVGAERAGRTFRRLRPPVRPLGRTEVRGRPRPQVGDLTMSTQHKDWVAKAELDRYGIVTVPTEFFEWGGFRYTHARDALAAAKRADRS